MRARDGRIGGVNAISGVLDLDEVSERLPGAERESIREGMSYLAIEIDARLERERAILDRVLVESAPRSTSRCRVRSASSTRRWR